MNTQMAELIDLTDERVVSLTSTNVVRLINSYSRTNILRCYPGVGKTCILRRYTDDTFAPTEMTLGQYTSNSSIICHPSRSRIADPRVAIYIYIYIYYIRYVFVPRVAGIDYARREVTLGDNLVRMNLWDTAGQERYQSVTLR